MVGRDERAKARSRPYIPSHWDGAVVKGLRVVLCRVVPPHRPMGRSGPSVPRTFHLWDGSFHGSNPCLSVAAIFPASPFPVSVSTHFLRCFFTNPSLLSEWIARSTLDFRGSFVSAVSHPTSSAICAILEEGSSSIARRTVSSSRKVAASCACASASVTGRRPLMASAGLYCPSPHRMSPPPS